MKTNKLTLLTFIGLVFFNFFLQSCSNDGIENNKNHVSRNILPSYQERVNNLEKLSLKIIDMSNSAKANKLNDINTNDYPETIIQSVVDQTKIIFEQLGVNENDLLNIDTVEMINTDDIYFAFGLALIVGYNNLSEIPTMSKVDGDFVECLMQATGLNSLAALGDAAAAIYSGEVAAGWAVDSAAATAFQSAALSAAKKIILRTATGFGAIIMLGSFTYCMLS